VELPADAVVLATHRRADDGLYREVEADRERLRDAGIEAVYRIGDCVVPRMVADAIFDGHRLARELETSDPARAAPFIRERRVLAS
jgi:dimethylamine/trimethylamine dehydrogenase